MHDFKGFIDGFVDMVSFIFIHLILKPWSMLSYQVIIGNTVTYMTLAYGKYLNAS